MDIKWPLPMEEAVSIVISEMSHDNKMLIANTPKCMLGSFHLSYGLYIRNKFQLWKYSEELNEELKAKAGNEKILRRVNFADLISPSIVEAVWEELQRDESLRGVLRDPHTGKELPEEWRNGERDIFDILKLRGYQRFNRSQI
jgi:hypothetical protein